MKSCLADMPADTATGPRGAKPVPSWAALLERFYERTGLSLPALQEVKPGQVPQPYRSLLVHSSDMTPTLAGFYGQPIRIRVLGRERRDDSYKREVVLWLVDDERSVEYGVIRIWLDRLTPAARRLVLQEQRPLGDILNAEAIPHLSWPKGFFRLRADVHACAALGLRHADLLYGRRNVLLDGARRLLAEVIEVLAPAPKAPADGDGKGFEGRSARWNGAATAARPLDPGRLLPELRK